MTPTARLLTAALLAASLAVPASLHASGPPNGRPATRNSVPASIRGADPWTLDWLVRIVRGLWTKNGPGLDPTSGSSAPPAPVVPNEGPGLDPSG
jgi:hypothetical protein